MSNPNNLHLRKLSIKNGVAVGKKTVGSNYLLDVSGNVKATKFYGDGSNLNYSTDISTNHNVRATAFYGDGSHLTGISSGSGSSSGASMFKNLVINGDMQINQYCSSINGSITGGALQTGSTGSTQALSCYVVDRFCCYRDGYVPGYCSQGWHTNHPETTGDISITTSILPFTDSGILYYSIMGRAMDDNSTAAFNLRYAFELQDTYQIYGKTVTLSFYYKCGAVFSGTTINYGLIMGAGEGIQRGAVTITSTLSSTATPASTWTRATFTTTLPSITTSNQYLGLFFSYTPVGAPTFVNDGNYVEDSIAITGVQLEKGSTATSFEYCPTATKLNLCQRYCKTLTQYDYVLGMNENASVMCFPIQLNTPMRIPPTTLYSQSNAIVYAWATSHQTSGLSIQASTINTVFLKVTCSTLTSITGPLLFYPAPNNTISFSAEM